MEKLGKGQPRKFKSSEEFANKAKEYIQLCDEKEELANVAGFCVYCMMTRETFYAQKNYYSDTFKIVNDMLEDRALNNKSAAPSVVIFYMKNKCGYKDRVEQEVTNTNKNYDMSNLSTEQIKELLKNED